MNFKVWPISGFCILMLSLVFIPRLSAENVSSEIINIDQDQKILFVDLGRDVLSIGDVMSVEGVDHPIYLEVVETSDAVSKLRVSKNQKFYSNPSEFDNLTIGIKVTLVYAIQDAGHSALTDLPVASSVPPTAPTVSVVTQDVSKNLSVVDPQAFVKPDISKESIQSIIDRMDTMADANVKLSNLLSQCQAQEGDTEKLLDNDKDLKKNIDDLNSKLVQTVEERDKYKKQSEDLLLKLNSLKDRLDHLDSIIGEH